MTSTPRVDPILHGVHLPQLSMAQKLHGEAGHLRHVHSIIEYDKAAVADQTVARSEGLIIEGRVEQRRRKISSQRARRIGPRRTGRPEAVPPPIDSTISPRVRPKAVSNRPP